MCEVKRACLPTLFIGIRSIKISWSITIIENLHCCACVYVCLGLGWAGLGQAELWGVSDVSQPEWGCQ